MSGALVRVAVAAALVAASGPAAAQTDASSNATLPTADPAPPTSITDRPVDILVSGYYNGTSGIKAGHVALLESRGYVVEVSDKPATASQMEGASVVLGQFINVHDAEARDAVTEYVYNGGRLLLMVDTQYEKCGVTEPCHYDFTVEAFGFGFDGSVQYSTVYPSTGGETHPVWNHPNTLWEFTDWCCDAYVEKITDPYNVKVLAIVSGQYSTVSDVPAIVVNDNPEWNGGMVVGAGLNMVVGWHGPDTRMFDNLMAFMLAGPPTRETASNQTPPLVSTGQVSPVIKDMVPAAAIMGGADGFSALERAADVEVFDIDGRTYAAVAAWEDAGGVQIVDMTYPTRPTPVSVMFDGSDEINTIGGAYDVEVFDVGDRTYAAVAVSWFYYGVRIMDITDPARPVQVSAMFDGFEGFDALDRVRDVEVYDMDGRTYVVAASNADSGVQVIDVTDPARPAPASVIVDDTGGFNALRGAMDIELYEADGRMYAAVSGSEGVQIIDMTDPADPAPVHAVFGSGEFSALRGPGDVDVYETEGRTYAVVAGVRVQIIDITDPARPAPMSTISDSEKFITIYPIDVEVFSVYGRTYVVVAAADGVDIMDITDLAHPTFVAAASYYEEGFDALKEAFDVEVFGMYGRTYAAVAAWEDDGVQIIDVTPSIPHRLDASVEVTGHERISHGDNDFVQVTAEITNYGPATLINDNRDHTILPGELHVSLNALADSYAEPLCDVTQDHCTRPNGEYVAYDDVTRGQAETYGVAVSEDDCTAWDRWIVPSGHTAEVKFCYRVDAEFEPESMQFYHISANRIVSVPFLEHGSCHLPYMRCDESALTPLN